LGFVVFFLSLGSSLLIYSYIQMSSYTEDLSISQQHISNNSSSMTDSLTAKLDNILHSSDEVIVQNSEFFKPSSNELTEQEEVNSLPQPESQSVPRLDIDERNRKSKI